MSNRSPKTIRCDDEVWSEFESFVEEAEDSKRGAKPKHLEKALQQYMGNDQLSRIEGKVDELLGDSRNEQTTHAHTKASDTVEKAREIHKRIRNNHDPIVKDVDVERAIEDIAGADHRTIEKYQGILRKRDLLFEHPGDSAVWTVEKDQWVGWVESYVDNNPGIEINDVIDDYGITQSDYITVVEQ